MRHWTLGIFASAIALASTSEWASAKDAFPERSIRLIVGASPGGITDIIARSFGAYVTKRTGAPVVVDNIAGAGGNLAFNQVAKASPDGYTIGLAAAGNIVINQHLYASMPFDPLKDLVPIAPIAAAPQVVIVPRDLPVKSLGDLIDLARAKPGSVNYGSAGAGTTNHLAGALFGKLAKVDVVHVPYRGVSQAITDLVAGRLQFMSVGAAPVLGFLKNGEMRALAVAANVRLPQLPDIPTASEAGLPGFDVSTWFGLVGPAKMPSPAIEALNELARDMIADPEEAKRFSDQVLAPMTMSPLQFAKTVRDDSAFWEAVIREARISIE